jgi:hypothetical protein
MLAGRRSSNHCPDPHQSLSFAARRSHSRDSAANPIRCQNGRRHRATSAHGPASWPSDVAGALVHGVSDSATRPQGQAARRPPRRWRPRPRRPASWPSVVASAVLRGERDAATRPQGQAARRTPRRWRPRPRLPASRPGNVRGALLHGERVPATRPQGQAARRPPAAGARAPAAQPWPSDVASALLQG